MQIDAHRGQGILREQKRKLRTEFSTNEDNESKVQPSQNVEGLVPYYLHTTTLSGMNIECI